MIVELTAPDTATLADVRELFKEYGDSLGPGHLCFQQFDRELAELPGAYKPPGGGLWLARIDGELAGCIALRPSSPGIAELKRLYLRPHYRGRGLGKSLAETAIAGARERKYGKVRLDTMPSMNEAFALYRSLGFQPIEAYCYNPVPGAVFMELTL
jgi:ribosomal protein S18 acetylase RimI-like enzyme